MPLIAYLGVYAHSVIAIVLGEKWLAAASVLQILAIAACVDGLTSTFGIVMITSGRTKAYLNLGVYQALLLSITFVIGVNWGLIGIAWATVIFTYMTLVPLAWFSFRQTPISLAVFFRAVSLPAVSTIITAIILMMVHPVLGSKNAFMDIGLSLVVAPLIYSGTWMVLPGGKQKLMEHISHIWRAIQTFWNSLISRMPMRTVPAVQRHS
jgi:PST family polysaccharide transporter